MVQHHICITFMTRSENYHLTELWQLLKQLFGEWSNVDPCVYVLACWKFYLQSYIVGQTQILIAVDQSLVEVKNHRILV